MNNIMDFTSDNIKLFNYIAKSFNSELDVVLNARQALRHSYNISKTLAKAKGDLLTAATQLLKKVNPDFKLDLTLLEFEVSQLEKDWETLKVKLFNPSGKYKTFASFCYEELSSDEMDGVIRLYNVKEDWNKFKLLQTDNIVSLIHRSRDTENNCDLNGYLQEYLDKKEGETKILYSLEDIAKLCQCSMETLRMGLSHKKLPAPDFVHEGIMLFSAESYYQFNSFLSRLVYNELEEGANANNIINNWILKGNNDADN